MSLLIFVLLIILATPSGAPHQMFPASGTVLRSVPQTAWYPVEKSGGSSDMAAGRWSAQRGVAHGKSTAVGVDVDGSEVAGSSPAAMGAPTYSGMATWYCSTVATCTSGYRPGDLIAAIDRKDSPFRQGDRVTVRAFGRAVTVLVVDVCQCAGGRLIDLSKAAFARLANPDLGVIPVTLELADAPLPTGPATDVGP